MIGANTKCLFLFQTVPQKTTRKQEGGGTVEGLILCMLGWASDRVREIMAVLWGSSVKRHPVGSELASPRLCMCWRGAEPKRMLLAERKSLCACVRLIKLLILLQVCLHGSVLSPAEVRPPRPLCSPGFCPYFRLLRGTGSLLGIKGRLQSFLSPTLSLFKLSDLLQLWWGCIWHIYTFISISIANSRISGGVYGSWNTIEHYEGSHGRWTKSMLCTVHSQRPRTPFLLDIF